MKRQVEFIRWLDDKGFGVFIEIQSDGSDGEYILARACIDEGELMLYEELLVSKHQQRLDKRWRHEYETNKSIIMDVEETLLGLSIEELESLKPSYYQHVINTRIAELEAEVKKNETPKVKRSRKKPVKTSD